MAKHPRHWRLQPTVPTVAEARGKIVLLRRFRATKTPKGIAAHPWRSSPSLRIQDNFRARDNKAKWKSVMNHFKASASAPPATLFINFSSGYQSGPFGVPNIRAVSNDINPRLEAYLAEEPPGIRGIVVMDFITAKSAALILSHNRE